METNRHENSFKDNNDHADDADDDSEIGKESF